MNSAKKIVQLSTLKRVVSRWRKEGKTITFTNGCFDILHFGHVRYLETAKNPKRVLVVGINSDRSVRKIKGPRRPVVPEQQRAAVLAALECVDYVTVFNEETPFNVIKALKPDILIKGADWKGKEVVGSDILAEYGGKVELIDYLKGCSTTNIIESVLKKCKK